MRELKYRVWDNENKSYNDPYSHSYYAMTQDGGLDFYCHGDHWGSCDPDVYFIEQCTGLTDKNGKEIYEGDIVRYSFINPNRTYTEPVSFGPIQDGEGYYHQEFLAWRTTYVDDGEAHSSLLDLVEPNWTCEIIGNIHENPELTGVKNE